MRTAKLCIDGKEYLLCFSVRVMRSCAERYGGVDQIGEALASGDQSKALDECIWLLSAMMDAGARYARMNDLDNPEPLSYDALYDSCGIDDFNNLKGKVVEAVNGGSEAHVEVTTPKNAETTREK